MNAPARSLVLMVLVMSAAALTSWISAGAFAGLLAVLIVIWVLDVAKLGPAAARLPSAVVGAVVALACFRFGERGLLMGAVIGVFALSAVFIARGASDGAVDGLARMTLVILYVPFMLSYAILIRQSPPGHRLLLALLVAVIGYKLASVVGNARLPGPAISMGNSSLKWSGAACGVAGAALAGMAFSAALDPPFGAAQMLLLGATVGVAAVLGELSAGLISDSEGASAAQMLPPELGALLLAAPAFFYVFRVYLT